MKKLRLLGKEKVPSKQAVACVTLAHNEESILEEFLEHYRSMGPIAFYIVDDHSTDTTCEILGRQTDVTVFRPVQGSTLTLHQADWRREILDEYSGGKWALTPDIDEHLVYGDLEQRSLLDVIHDLEEESACALFALMIDMYDDCLVKDHVYRGQGLRKAFPFFDGPESPPHGYCMVKVRGGPRQRWPTPGFIAIGGMRHRLFSSTEGRSNATLNWLLRKNFRADGRHFRQPLNMNRWLTRKLSKRFVSSSLNIGKLPLLKWPTGARFVGGPHAVNRRLEMSCEVAALLHYKFTRGAERIEYFAREGRDYSGGLYNRRMLEELVYSDTSPVTEYSRRYVDSRSLDGILFGRGSHEA